MKKTKGIVLAGGSGTRLYPLTRAISKQLLPIYDKPMIYYPLSVLMLAEIRDILIITTPQDQPQFKRLLGNGEKLGIRLEYIEQQKPDGLAHALMLGEKYLDGHPCCLILGDNIFYGQGLKEKLCRAKQRKNGATIFAYKVNRPERFGVAVIENGQVISLEEKPVNPLSSYAVTGLYFYDEKAPEMARNIQPSERGEREITDLNRMYMEQSGLNVEVFGRGFAWLDAGSHDSLIQAGQFIQTIESRQGMKVACLEEIAYLNKWLKKEDILARSNELVSSGYGDYLKEIISVEK